MTTTKSDLSGREITGGGPNYLVGVPATLVLGPIGLAAAALAAVAIVSNLVAGLDPANWFSGGVLDELVGGGSG